MEKKTSFFHFVNEHNIKVIMEMCVYELSWIIEIEQLLNRIKLCMSSLKLKQGSWASSIKSKDKLVELPCVSEWTARSVSEANSIKS
jgi:hypothetical protein